MSKDYPSWNNIEVSDDEDDTHPNVDTPSLFRWRHETRIQKDEEMAEAKKFIDNEKTELESKKKKLEALKDRTANNEDFVGLIDNLEKDLKNSEKELADHEKHFAKEKRLRAWNVDTISKDGFSKTVINTKPSFKENPDISEDEKIKRYQSFISTNEKLVKQYGMFGRYNDSKRFLQEHPHLICDDTSSYLALWCIDLVIDEKMELMKHVSHQCVAMQYLLQISQQMDANPRAFVGLFFTNIAKDGAAEYKAGFDLELQSFRNRIKKRAEQKIYQAREQLRKKEREEQLKGREERIKASPGGLDPMEVFESLPEELQKCFSERNIELLPLILENMPKEEALRHMERCVKSGMWVPSANTEVQEPEEPIKIEEQNAVQSDDDVLPPEFNSNSENFDRRRFSIVASAITVVVAILAFLIYLLY